MKRLAFIFVVSFALNAVWENLHSVLYASYQGGPITEFILLRASLFDAIVITLMLAPFVCIRSLQLRSWLIIPAGILIGVINEWYGLSTHRWAYDSLMPIIPVIKVGLSPALQLGILGYLSLIIQRHMLRSCSPVHQASAAR